jgi:hypothetical protein
MKASGAGLAAPATVPKAICRVSRSSLRTVAAAGASASRNAQQLERRPQQMRRGVAARAAAVSVRAETIAVTFTLKQKVSPSPAVTAAFLRPPMVVVLPPPAQAAAAACLLRCLDGWKHAYLIRQASLDLLTHSRAGCG